MAKYSEDQESRISFRRWIPVPSLIPKLSKIVNNMKAEKTWTVNDVDETRKDIVLTSILKKQKNLEKKLEATTTSEESFINN